MQSWLQVFRTALCLQRIQIIPPARRVHLRWSSQPICSTSWRTSQASQTPTRTLVRLSKPRSPQSLKLFNTGIPFSNTTPFSLGIVENGQQILGDHLIGLQAGNEPDLYAAHGHRPSVSSLYILKLEEVRTDENFQTYSQFDYFGEVGTLIQQIANDPLIPKKDNMLIVPSVQVTWTPESVLNTGIVSSYSSSILSLAVER